VVAPGWRLAPFNLYPGTADTFAVVVAGHSDRDMWTTGEPNVETLIAEDTTTFLRRYVVGDLTVDVCGLGKSTDPITTVRVRSGSWDSALDDCPTAPAEE
jgi:hypothetical protein